MYKCNRCGHQFEEYKTKQTTYEDYYGCPVPAITPMTLYICPNCDEEDDCVELKKCDCCEEWFEELIDTDGKVNGGCGDYCEQCCIDADISLD